MPLFLVVVILYFIYLLASINTVRIPDYNTLLLNNKSFQNKTTTTKKTLEVFPLLDRLFFIIVMSVLLQHNSHIQLNYSLGVLVGVTIGITSYLLQLIVLRSYEVKDKRYQGLICIIPQGMSIQ